MSHKKSKLHHNPNNHDAFFKQVMANKQVAIDFFQEHLPKELKTLIDFNTLEQRPTNFITRKLKQKHTDVLYAATLKNQQPAYLYLLVEQQSTSEKLMPLRMLNYVLNIINHHLGDDENPHHQQLPVVVPTIVYNGRKPYQHSTRFLDLYPAELQSCMQNLFCEPMPLIDLNSRWRETT